MSFEKVLADLKSRKFAPIYFLMGDEPYYIDLISDYIEKNVLDEGEREFNQTILYGKDVEVPQLINAARRFPMMAEYQVIIVREAQNIRDLDTHLEPYVQSPVSSTILVFCYKYKSLDKRKKIVKTIQDKGVLLGFDKLRSDKIPTWISNYLSTRKYAISPKASLLLSEYLGNDLSKIVNELDKLMILVKQGSEITVDDISKNIGISKDYNVFEFQDALGKKDILKANRISLYFAANQKDHPLVVTLATLFSFFSKIILLHKTTDRSPQNVASQLKINPFFAKDYEMAAKNHSLAKSLDVISTLRDYDLKSKGVDSGSADHGELLKEMVYKILH